MLKKKLRSFILRLRKFFVNRKTFRRELKRILLTTQVALFGIAACSTFAILDFAQGRYPALIADIFAVFIYVICLFLIRRGKFSAAKFMVITGSDITLIHNASHDGRGAGNEFLWFPLICAVFLLFSASDYLYILLCFLITFAGICFLELTDYSFLLDTVGLESYRYNNFISCFIISILLICIFMSYLIRLSSDSEKKFERLNRTLRKRNENLKRTNNELDSFVYKASHDLRAPLTSLLGLIEIVKKETDLKVIQEFSELQEKSIRKLDSYIIDILNISRNSRMTIETVRIQFKEMLDQAFQQLNYMQNCPLIQKKIELRENAPFYCDEKRLNIIFNNLLSNSIRYCDTGKAQSVLNIDIFTDTEKAEIVIYDNGIGIAPEHLPKVFDMFHRATEKNSGSGLGLYIVKETLMKLNGTVEIKSEYGKYTEVRIVLPNSLEESTMYKVQSTI